MKRRHLELRTVINLIVDLVHDLNAEELKMSVSMGDADMEPKEVLDQIGKIAAQASAMIFLCGESVKILKS